MLKKLDIGISEIEQVEAFNALVDIVNELQKQIDKVSCAILDLATPNGENKTLKSIQVEPADPYAKYRKWNGKLCRFWNVNKDDAIYDILEEVITDWSYQFKTKRDYIFDHCEPVKPDDDIIYKGNANE